MLTRLAVCGYMAVARLTELAFSARNVGASETREGAWSRRTFPLIVALHAAVIGGVAAFGGRPRRFWLIPLALVQPLRFWALSTLGPRWNARGAVPIAMEVETRGPYAFVRHPNYAVVAVELFCLPVAFGSLKLAALAALVNAVLLSERIREEEELLFRLPGYREHFGRKARFIPGVF